MKKILIYYSFVIVSIMTLTSFLKAENSAQFISAIIFSPLFLYFFGQVLPKRQKAIAIIPPKSKIKTVSKKTNQSKVFQAKEKNKTEEGEIVEEGIDNDRRVFLKLIATAGAGLFMMSIFTKKTHAAFFGSVPGPGTVALKDTTGTQIDPAVKQPTDGYRISEIDDSSSPAYYGFVDKTGAWFIMKEESSGAYRYAKGSSGFSTGWSSRTSLTYGYFDEVF